MNININSPKLLSLIMSFYELSGMKIAIYDNEFKEILTYPEHSCAFCEAVWECSGRNKCDSFTADMCRKSSQKRETLVYTCHAGLTEVVLPLQENDIVFGYAVCGQITNQKDREKFVEDVLQRCSEMELEPDSIKELIKDVKYRTDNQLNATLQIINALASYIILQKMVYVSEKKLGLQIVEYIRQNIYGDLSVKALCRKFAVSKSKLYIVVKEYTPQGLAKFIRSCRIDTALREMKNNPDKPLTAIAKNVGFENYEYFLRVIKWETGKSVKEIRKKYNEETKLQ
ncbi:MAG: PocR ligand-binding domain-containing protein [Clostridia bacterium]|nr:PocR ligand-binding domain-containing protein [Clostridia bacterium]